MGFSIGASQCLVAPPYFFAGICMYTTSWAADKWRMRGPVLMGLAVMGLIGLPIMVCCSDCSFSQCSPLGTATESSADTVVSGLRQIQRSPVLRRLPHHRRSQRASPRRHGLPSEQHPRAVETGLLLRHFGRVRWNRWDFRLSGVPFPRRAELPARHVRGDHGAAAYHRDLWGQ